MNFPPWFIWSRIGGGTILLGAILWPFFVGKILQMLNMASHGVKDSSECALSLPSMHEIQRLAKPKKSSPGSSESVTLDVNYANVEH